MVKMLVPSLWGDLRTVASTMVKYGVAAKQVFGLITDLIQGRTSDMHGQWTMPLNRTEHL